MPLLPYGTAIREVMRTGDLRRMEASLAEAKAYVASAQPTRAQAAEWSEAISKLEAEIGQLRRRR